MPISFILYIVISSSFVAVVVGRLAFIMNPKQPHSIYLTIFLLVVFDYFGQYDGKIAYIYNFFYEM